MTRNTVRAGRVRRGLVGTAAALAVAGTAAVPAAAQPHADHGHTRGGHGAARQAMDAAVDAGVPGVAGQVRDRRGVWNATAGTGDLATGTPRDAHDHFRIGSISKTFVSTVLLQLEAEGRIRLDDRVEKWLPGVVRGHGHDGRRITVRQLLNHTSGVFNVTSDPEFVRTVFSPEFLKHRYDTWTNPQLVAIAMRHAPMFEPGTSWSYSNTNYVLAAMIVERITGHGYGHEIERRVLRPLKLDDTSVPGTDPRMPEPSGRAYSKLSQDPGAEKIYDVTELNPSVAGPAGGMISDAADLNTFYRALLTGRLLPAKQLAEMKTTVSTGDEHPGSRYGLALVEQKLSCGVRVWGHDGGIHGSSSRSAVTADGKHALSFNFNGDWTGDSDAVVEAEFCGD